MIKSITINNYKAFGTNPEWNKLELRPITVVVGKNNSGKSSLLKLISILSTMSYGASSDPISLKNEFGYLGGRFQDLFHNNETSSMTIGLEYEDGNILNLTYLMDKGAMYVQLLDSYSINNKKEFEFIQTNPFKVLIEQTCSTHTNKKNPYAFTTDYIGPLRVSINRNIQSDGNNTDTINVDGKNVCEVMLKSFNTDKRLFRYVADWFEQNLDCPGLTFERNSESSGSFSLAVRHGKATVNVADIGQGISQVLPFIVSTFMEHHADITIVEQPVLHLHPAAHQSVAIRAAESAKDMNRTFLFETHSYNFILALRDMVADPSNPLSPGDVIIYSVEQDEDESWLKPIIIDKSGELSDWPEGVFNESYELLKSIRKHSSK